MAIAIVSPENLKYFKQKQDAYNEGKFAKKTDLPTVPTKVSELSNDSGYQTSGQVTAAINSALTSALVYKGVKATVAELPASGNKIGDLWHVTATAGEYAWDGKAWQEMGSTVDLSGKQDKLSDAQQAAVDSGITAAKVKSYDGKVSANNSTVTVTAFDGTTTTFTTNQSAGSSVGKAMTDAQKSAVNSGITSSKVSTYDGYAATIAGKQGKLTAGTNVTIADDGTISAKDTTYSAATTAAAGLMSAADKTKLDSLDTAQAMTDAEIDALFATA